ITKENKPLVLIVEDHADFRTFIGEILEEEYRTIEAKNGLIGLEKAIDEIPDLIISDVMMPEMSGYEFCEKIKNDERTCHIPVILLTAKAAQEDRIEGLSIGADDYLSKPFESKELLTRVNNLISQRRKLQVYFQQHILIKTSGEKIVSAEEEFVHRAIEIVEENIGNEDFSVDDFAGNLNMSRSQLHRKIHALTGKSATSFIRTIRLQRAAELLKTGNGNVTEIAFDVGFGSQSYFTRCFAEQFGCSPSEYKRRYG
ncbi:MAG: DNA-binding response regulator, partial [Bacteroidetes bacterium]